MKYNFYTLEEAIAILDIPEIDKSLYCFHLTYSVFRDTLNMLNYMYTQERIDKSDIELAKEALRLILYCNQYSEIVDIINYDELHYEDESYEPKTYKIPEE